MTIKSYKYEVDGTEFVSQIDEFLVIVQISVPYDSIGEVAVHVAHMGKKRNACRNWVEKPEGKRLKGRPGCGQKVNIKTDLREIGWGAVDWIDLAQDRDQWRALVNMVMNFWGSINCWEILE
jgi:hypothetical protein